MQNLYHYYEMRESPEFMKGLFLGSTALLISLVDQGGLNITFILRVSRFCSFELSLIIFHDKSEFTLPFLF